MHLILSLNGRSYQVSLNQSLVTIGRSRCCTICINDRQISERHLELRKIDRANHHYYLLDHGSTNGTRVNGIPTDHCQLGDNDVIEIGSGLRIYYLVLPILKNADGVESVESQIELQTEEVEDYLNLKERIADLREELAQLDTCLHRKEREYERLLNSVVTLNLDRAGDYIQPVEDGMELPR